MQEMLSVLSMFSFYERWNLPLLALLVFVTIRYFRLMKQALIKDTTVMKKISFLSAVVLYYFASGTPFHTLSYHFLFSIKMLQESILLFAIPILFIASLPEEYVRTLLWHYRIRKSFAVMTHPVFSMVMFYILYSVYHMPVVFTAVMNGPVLRSLSEFILLMTSLLMWWSIISSASKLQDSKKVLLVIANSVLLFVPMYPLAFFAAPKYEFMGHALLHLTPSMDFKLGAGLILIYQKIIVVAVLAVIFFKWFKREDTIDPVNVATVLGMKRK